MEVSAAKLAAAALAAAGLSVLPLTDLRMRLAGATGMLSELTPQI